MSRPGEPPVLITTAGPSPQEEYERRRRRYGAMMLGRVICVIAAFVVGSLLHAIWASLALIALAAALPWAAVLIANDRLPKAERERMAMRRKAGGPSASGQTALPTAGSAAPHPTQHPNEHPDDDDPARPTRSHRIIEG